MQRALKISVGCGLAGVVTSLTIAASVATAAGNWPCPEALGNRVAQGLHVFEYKSWSWEHSSEYVFCNCVRNKNEERGLFISWGAAALSTILPPGEEAYSFNTFPTNQSVTKMTALHFGAALKRANVQTVLHASQVPTGETVGGNLLKLASYQPGYTTSPEIKEKDKSVESASVVYVPSSRLIQYDISGKEYLKILEDNPSLLQKMEFKFVSKPNRDADGNVSIAYVCTYRVVGADSDWGDRPSYFIRIRDRRLHKLMFRQDAPVPPRSTGSSRGYQFEATGPSLGKTAVRQEGTVVDFLGPDGKTVIASAPVTHIALPKA